MNAWTVAAIGATVFLSSDVRAETVPSRETAGAEEARFSEDRRRDVRATAEPVPAVEAPDEPARPVSSAPSERFPVTDVRFSGNLSLPDSELLPYVEPLFGRPVSLDDVRAAVEGIKRHYRSKGYIAAYAYVPPQQMAGGVLKVDVLEGRLGRIEVAGTKRRSPDSVRDRFSLRPGDVLRQDAIRRDLDRLNAEGGLRAKAVLEPGDTVGTTDLRVEVKETVPYRVTGELTNAGTKNTGFYRYGLGARHDDLTGHMDRLEGSVQLGKGVDAFGAGYSVPVGRDMRAGYAYSHANVDVGGTFSALEVKGKARTHRAYVTKPLYADGPLEVEGTLGFDVKHVENKLLGLVTGKDDLSVPNLEFRAKRPDAAGITQLTSRFNYGIADFLGASAERDTATSRLGTGGEFFSWRGTAIRLHKLPGTAYLTARGTAQLTPDPLTPSEQLSLGGARSVRGYQEGEYLGDHGAFASFDVYFPASFLPDHWRLPFAETTAEKQFELVFFADAGTATLKRPLAGEKKSHDLAGAGAGVRVRLAEKLYGRLEWAVPLGDRPLDGKDKAFYFTVSYDFL